MILYPTLGSSIGTCSLYGGLLMPLRDFQDGGVLCNKYFFRPEYQIGWRIYNTISTILVACVYCISIIKFFFSVHFLTSRKKEEKSKTKKKKNRVKVVFPFLFYFFFLTVGTFAREAFGTRSYCENFVHTATFRQLFIYVISLF